MTTRLTDNERTLLSAHSDGELSGPDRELVERLLAGSEEARDYVRDLRALTEFSQAAFPAASATGVAVGSRITSSSIQTAARGASKSAGITWGVAGLAAAAVTTVAVLTSMLGGGDASRPEPGARSAATSSIPAAPMTATAVGFDLDAAALTVPAITSEELIDFAVSGRLPVDSARNCYVSVAPKQGSLAIDVHSAAGSVPAQLSGLDLRAVPGIDSIERAIRTSLLQSDDNGLAISCDLPALRLRVLEELQVVADELPAEIRRTMDEARAELGREYLRLSDELRRSRPRTERPGVSTTRFVVVAATDLPRPGDSRDLGRSYTILAGDRRTRTVEVSSTELSSLASFVEGPRFAALERPEPARARTAAAPVRVFVRRPVSSARANAGTRSVVTAAPEDSTISFEQLQILRQRGETLDGIYIRTESFIDRANRILIQADSIRRRIELIRSQQIEGREDEIDPAETVDPIEERVRIDDEMGPE